MNNLVNVLSVELTVMNMDVKAFRGTIFELEQYIDEFLSENHPTEITDFRMFPVDKSQNETELSEPYYEVLMFHDFPKEK